MLNSVTLNQPIMSAEFEQGASLQTVKGRLKENFNFWQNTLEANDFVLETINEGVKLPFIKTPLKAEFKINASALDNKEFVDSALKELIMSKCVIEVEPKPHVISPLSVSRNSSGKKRFILDLRYVNIHLWKQSVKFEDLKVFQNYVSEDAFLYKFDLQKGYYHLDVFSEHQTFLGFSWFHEGRERFFVFTVLPFGLSNAPFIFTKVVRPLVKYWRSSGVKILVFIDDRAGSDTSFDQAVKNSNFVK